MALYQVLGLCLVMATLTVATTFRDCGSKGAQVYAVTITPCRTEPCTVNCNSYFRFTIPIKTLENVTHPIYSVFANVSGKMIQLPFLSQDACMITRCPIVAGSNQVIDFKFRFSNLIPNKEFDLLFTWIDDRGGLFFCIDVPFKMHNCKASLMATPPTSKEPDFDLFDKMDEVKSVKIKRI